MASHAALSSQQARYNASDILNKLFAELNVQDYKLYLTGDTNFRYSIYPEYKAQRLKVPKPEFLQDVKDYLVDEYDAEVSEGCEADDRLGVDQHIYIEQGIDSRIVSIDKDLDQIIGYHYNPKHKREYVISPNDSIRFFYYQLLVGDSADNIKGAKGIGPKKAESILQDCVTELEHYEAVKDYFSCDEELELNAQVLWIWRKPNDRWEVPK
jgi:5'-3' exonuclease